MKLLPVVLVINCHQLKLPAEEWNSPTLKSLSSRNTKKPVRCPRPCGLNTTTPWPMPSLTLEGRKRSVRFSWDFKSIAISSEPWLDR